MQEIKIDLQENGSKAYIKSWVSFQQLKNMLEDKFHYGKNSFIITGFTIDGNGITVHEKFPEEI